MVIRKPSDPRYSQVTPKQAYLNRRRFLASSVALGVLANAPAARATTKLNGVAKGPYNTDKGHAVRGHHPLQQLLRIRHRQRRSSRERPPAEDFPWMVKVEGEVAKPITLDLDAFKIAPLEERIYRHRCVEAWSMVIPWIGFPLNALLKRAQPTAKARIRRI